MRRILLNWYTFLLLSNTFNTPTKGINEASCPARGCYSSTSNKLFDWSWNLCDSMEFSPIEFPLSAELSILRMATRRLSKTSRRCLVSRCHRRPHYRRCIWSAHCKFVEFASTGFSSKKIAKRIIWANYDYYLASHIGVDLRHSNSRHFHWNVVCERSTTLLWTFHRNIMLSGEMIKVTCNPDHNNNNKNIERTGRNGGRQSPRRKRP